MHYQLLLQEATNFNVIQVVILSGNAPTIGTGSWSAVSGTATITTPTSNTSGVTGVGGGNKCNTAMDHYKWNL
jgi:hypothetical protein